MALLNLYKQSAKAGGNLKKRQEPYQTGVAPLGGPQPVIGKPLPPIYGSPPPPPNAKPPTNPYQTGVAPIPTRSDGVVEQVAPLPPPGADKSIQVDRTGSPGSHIQGPKVTYKNIGGINVPTSFGPTPVQSGPAKPHDPMDAFDPKTRDILSLYPEFKSTQNLNSVNTLRGQGFDTQQDAWTKSILKRQDMDQANLRNTAMGDVAGAQASAEANMAMRGGLSGGSRERMAATGALNRANALQDVARSGMEKRADIDIEGERRKDHLRQLVTGYDVGDVGAENLYSSKKGDTYMEALANQQLADSIRAGGGGGQNPLDPNTWKPNGAGEAAGIPLSPDTYAMEKFGVPEEAQWIANPIGKGGREGLKKVTSYGRR